MSVDPTNRVFTPAKAASSPLSTELVQEDAVAPQDELQSWTKDYSLFFVNTLHMYLRIPISLFELYAKEFNKQLKIMHFVLPGPLLVEDVAAPAGFATPEAGWSRYLHGMPKEDWPHFKNWLSNAKWLAQNAAGEKVLYSCEAEDVEVRDPVKLQTLQVVGIKEFVPITFFMPSNLSGKLYLNTKNGPPFNCIYVNRNGPGAGEAAALFKKLREVL
jgi:hypothetical protein